MTSTSPPKPSPLMQNASKTPSLSINTKKSARKPNEIFIENEANVILTEITPLSPINSSDTPASTHSSNSREDSQPSSPNDETASESSSSVSTILDLNKVPGQCFIFTTAEAQEPTQMLIQLLEEQIGVGSAFITVFNVTERPFLLRYMVEMQSRQVGVSYIESEAKKLPQVFFNDTWIGNYTYILDWRDRVTDLWELQHKRIDREQLGRLYGVYREQEAFLYLSPSTLAMVKPSPLTHYAQAWTAFTMLLKLKPLVTTVIFRVRWHKRKRYSVDPSFGVLTTQKPSVRLRITVLEKIMDSYENDFFEVDSLGVSEDKEWTLESISTVMSKREADVMCDLLTTSFILEERKKSE